MINDRLCVNEGSTFRCTLFIVEGFILVPYSTTTVNNVKLKLSTEHSVTLIIIKINKDND